MKKIFPYLVSALFTLFILLIHLFTGFTTMINGGANFISNEAIADVIDLHKNHPVFMKRKVTTMLVEILSENLSLDIGWSFVFVNFLCIFFSGLLVFWLSKTIINRFDRNIISLVSFYCCFPIVFLFFPPVYSYDEPLQFVFILLSFIFFYKSEYLLFLLSFSLSLVIRETGLILLPGLFIVYYYKERMKLADFFSMKRSLRILLIFGLPVLIYVVYTHLMFVNVEQVELAKNYFKLRISRTGYNFQNLQFSIETLVAILLVFAMPFYFILSNKKELLENNNNLPLIKAFFVTFVLNTMIVLSIARAREVRLLVLPMFFLWPIFGEIINTKINYDSLKRTLSNFTNTIILLVLVIIVFYLSFIIYQPTTGPRLGIFNLYLFSSLTLIALDRLIKNQQ